MRDEEDRVLLKGEEIERERVFHFKKNKRARAFV